MGVAQSVSSGKPEGGVEDLDGTAARTKASPTTRRMRKHLLEGRLPRGRLRRVRVKRRDAAPVAVESRDVSG